jgi:hypothetical protein
LEGEQARDLAVLLIDGSRSDGGADRAPADDSFSSGASVWGDASSRYSFLKRRSGPTGLLGVPKGLIVAADQRAQRGDLLVAGGRLATRPVGQLRNRGRETLAAGQQLCQSDQPVDKASQSQPAASPRTNRSGRTSPPRPRRL